MKLRVLIGSMVAYFAYLLIGAAVFSAIERPMEVTKCGDTRSAIESFRTLLRDNGGNLTIANFTDIALVIQTAGNFGIRVDNDLTVVCSINWDFESAFFFSGTVVTTIGYGHISPNTDLGRSICIIYAIIGIPLFALMFTGMGECISKLIKRLHKRAQGKAKRTWVAKTVVILIVASSFLVFCIFIPAAIFHAVEKWTYRDSIYYSFITLTTIGFGDFVAGTSTEITYVPIYRIMVYFWILFGMAFMATLISLISDFFKKTGEKVRTKPKVYSTEEDAAVMESGLAQENTQQPPPAEESKPDNANRKPDSQTEGSSESLEKRPFRNDDDDRL